MLIFCGRFVNLDAIRMIDIQCLTHKYTFLDTFLFSVTTPLILIAVALALCWSRHVYLTSTQPAEELKNVLKENRNLFRKAVIFMLYLIYPGVSATILTVFKCDDVAGTWYLHVDQRVVCFEDTWNQHALIAAVAVVIYPIGIPLAFASALMVAHAAGNLFEDPALLAARDSLEATVYTLEQEYEDTESLRESQQGELSLLKDKKQTNLKEELAIANEELAALRERIQHSELIRDCLDFLYKARQPV